MIPVWGKSPGVENHKALQIAMKIWEMKSKGEKETYTHLNAEFQRTARRDKKAFLSEQCKEIVTGTSELRRQSQ